MSIEFSPLDEYEIQEKIRLLEILCKEQRRRLKKQDWTAFFIDRKGFTRDMAIDGLDASKYEIQIPVVKRLIPDWVKGLKSSKTDKNPVIERITFWRKKIDREKRIVWYEED